MVKYWERRYRNKNRKKPQANIYQCFKFQEIRVYRAFVLENQGRVTFAFSFANFDGPSSVSVSWGGTQRRMHRVKPVWAEGPVCGERRRLAGATSSWPSVEKRWRPLLTIRVIEGDLQQADPIQQHPCDNSSHLGMSKGWVGHSHFLLRANILFILLETREQRAFWIAHGDLRRYQAFSYFWVALNCSLHFVKVDLGFSSVQMSQFPHTACNTSNWENTSSRDASKP